MMVSLEFFISLINDSLVVASAAMFIPRSSSKSKPGPIAVPFLALPEGAIRITYKLGKNLSVPHGKEHFLCNAAAKTLRAVHVWNNSGGSELFVNSR
jgi:oxalate decarboxylase/phosphoglucose isomerase-like protein (cupin superfamily)